MATGSSACTQNRREMMRWPGTSPPKTQSIRWVPTTGIDSSTPWSTPRLPPDIMSFGRIPPVHPTAMPRTSRLTQISQFSPRGRRNAPVKNSRSNCRHTAATKISAAQWWICRISSPPRTSKLICSVDLYAWLIRTPLSAW